MWLVELFTPDWPWQQEPYGGEYYIYIEILVFFFSFFLWIEFDIPKGEKERQKTEVFLC